MNTIPVRLLAAALMVVVFACGFLSGRLSAPRGEAAAVMVPDEPSPRDPTSASRRVMRRYAEDLNLTREQARELRPLFEAAGERMLPLPKNSEARLKELERFHAEMNPHLTEEQRVKARAILDRAIQMRRGTGAAQEK